MQKTSILSEIENIIFGLDHTATLILLKLLEDKDYNGARDFINRIFFITNEVKNKKNSLVTDIENFVKSLNEPEILDLNLDLLDNESVLKAINSEARDTRIIFTYLNLEYPEFWKEYLRVSSLDPHMKDRLNNGYYFNSKRKAPFYNFIESAYTLFNPGEQKEFENYFPSIFKLFKFEDVIKLNEKQLSLIGKFADDTQYSPIKNLKLYRYLFNKLELSLEQKEIFKKNYPNEFQWLHFEADANNISTFSEDQLNAMDNMFETIKNTDDFLAFISQFKSKISLNPNQQQLFNSIFNKNEIESDNEKTQDEDVYRNENNKRISKNLTNQDQESGKKHKTDNQTPGKYRESVVKAATIFHKKFKKGYTNTGKYQKTKIINNKAYLKYYLAIPPETDSTEQNHSAGVLNLLQKTFRPLDTIRSNILIIDKEGKWKKENPYYNKKGNLIGYTVEENLYPVDTVIVRGTTAGTLVAKFIDTEKKPRKSKEKEESQPQSKSTFFNSNNNPSGKAALVKPLVFLQEQGQIPPQDSEKEHGSSTTVSDSNAEIIGSDSHEDSNLDNQKAKLIERILELRKFIASKTRTIVDVDQIDSSMNEQTKIRR